MRQHDLGTHWPNLLMFIITFLWASMMFIAPLSQPADTIDMGETGIVFPQLDNEKKYEHIDNYFVRRVYEAGDRNCHQHGERSVFIKDNQMPFCTRCVAIFVGMALGALIALLIFVRLDWKWVVAGLVPMGIDGTIQLLTSYESNNILRILTGLPAGLITTLALGGVLFEVGVMFSKLREEKMAEFKAKGEKGPKIPYNARSILYAGIVIFIVSGLVVGDYVLHDGYDEEEPDLKLRITDAPFDSNGTTLAPGDEAFIIQHVSGKNLDWAKLSVKVRWEDNYYDCVVLKVNDIDYDKITNHITESGDTVSVTPGVEEIPTGGNVWVYVKRGSNTLWRSEVLIS